MTAAIVATLCFLAWPSALVLCVLDHPEAFRDNLLARCVVVSGLFWGAAVATSLFLALAG